MVDIVVTALQYSVNELDAKTEDRDIYEQGFEDVHNNLMT